MVGFLSASNGEIEAERERSATAWCVGLRGRLGMAGIVFRRRF